MWTNKWKMNEKLKVKINKKCWKRKKRSSIRMKDFTKEINKIKNKKMNIKNRNEII